MLKPSDIGTSFLAPDGDGSALSGVVKTSDIGTTVLATDGDGSSLTNVLKTSDIGTTVLAPNGDGSSLSGILTPNGDGSGLSGVLIANGDGSGLSGVVKPDGDGSTLSGVLKPSDIGSTVQGWSSNLDTISGGDGSSLSGVLKPSDIGTTVLAPDGDGSLLTGTATGLTAGVASSVDWSGVTSTPTTVAGYGITDANSTTGPADDMTVGGYPLSGMPGTGLFTGDSANYAQIAYSSGNSFTSFFEGVDTSGTTDTFLLSDGDGSALTNVLHPAGIDSGAVAVFSGIDGNVTSLGDNATTPTNTTTPVGWLQITVGNVTSWIPYFQ